MRRARLTVQTVRTQRTPSAHAWTTGPRQRLRRRRPGLRTGLRSRSGPKQHRHATQRVPTRRRRASRRPRCLHRRPPARRASPRRPASPGDGGPKDVPDLSIFHPESTDCSFDPAPSSNSCRPPTSRSRSGCRHSSGSTGIRTARRSRRAALPRRRDDPSRRDGRRVQLATTRHRPPHRPRGRAVHHRLPARRGLPTRAVWARDQECRVPGCTTPAHRSDLDHDIDHDRGGPTDLSNLSAKHRRHHNHTKAVAGAAPATATSSPGPPPPAAPTPVTPPTTAR